MKNGKIIFIATLLLVSLLCISAVSAADDAASDVIADNTDETVLDAGIDDADIGDSESDELGDSEIGPPLMVGTFTTLNDDVNNGADVVNLSYDYSYNEYSDYDFQHGILIDRNVTINGNGIQINGNNNARIFHVLDYNTVTFNNISFVNANAPGDYASGGAIWVESGATVQAINCKFINNEARYGGAIAGGDATNCIFTGNSAAGIGAGIYIGDATGCTFINNTASSGGAIYNGNATDCTFTANKGSAIYNGNAIDCTFTGNSANTGGAIYNGNATDCTFIANSANTGGAIAYGSATDCTFTGNSANTGAI